MSNKKKIFSNLATITAGAIAGTAIALSPVVAIAGEHADGSEKHDCKCAGDKKAECEKHECKCAGDKKAECEKSHHEDSGEKSCGGEGKCSGKK